MLQKLPVNDLKCVEDISEFNESFIRNYNANTDERYFLEVDVQYFEKLHALDNDLLFLPEKMKIEKSENLLLI